MRVRKYCRCSKRSGWPVISYAASCSRQRFPSGWNITKDVRRLYRRLLRKNFWRSVRHRSTACCVPRAFSIPRKDSVRHVRAHSCATPCRRVLARRTLPGSGRSRRIRWPHCDDSTEGDYVNSLTFTELFSGWTENRAIWNKSADSVLIQLRELETTVPFAMKDFHTDNGGEFLNWALHRHLNGRAVKLPWTRSRAYRKNDNAHCEQKNWTHVRQLFGHDRLEHPELVPLMNDLYGQEWSQFTNHFKPTFKLVRREKKGGKTKRIYEPNPQTPYQRLLNSSDVPEATKARLRTQHALLDPFALKKSIETKLRKFFTVLGNLNREATKP